MTFSKRMFDIVFALALCIVLGPVILGLMLALLVLQGRPLFYAGERMRGVDQSFRLWKFRTMSVAPDSGGVSGGDKQSRITPMGQFLRRTRLDELPQLWNILRGDISFVGPRPPPAPLCRQPPQSLRPRSGLPPRRHGSGDRDLSPHRRTAACAVQNPTRNRTRLRPALHFAQGTAGSDILPAKIFDLGHVVDLAHNRWNVWSQKWSRDFGPVDKLRQLSKDEQSLAVVLFFDQFYAAQRSGMGLISRGKFHIWYAVIINLSVVA